MNNTLQTPELETDAPEMVAIAEAMADAEKLTATNDPCACNFLLDPARKLSALALDEVDLYNELADAFTNSGASHYTALLGALKALRLSLDIIEVAAHEGARREMSESAQTLAAWQAAGVA